MDNHIENKIKDAQDILERFGANQGKLAPYVLLALCNIKPHDEWQDASRKSMTISKEIIVFVNEFYNAGYNQQSRDSFRYDALNYFLNKEIVELNPDNPDLKPSSPNTHYAISPLVLNTIKKYKTPEWEIALDNYLKFRNQKSDSIGNNIILTKIEINSYKSIVDDTIDLGIINVFIGANGSGKTNILEALATIGAARSNDLNFDGLYSRGVRIARPDLIISSFLDAKQKSSIDINLTFDNNGDFQDCKSSLSPANLNDIYTKWIDLAQEETYPEFLLEIFRELTNKQPGIDNNSLVAEANKIITDRGLSKSKAYDHLLTEYGIFDLNTKSLRGITAADSKKTPLGLNGEGLDLLLASFNSDDKDYLSRKCKKLFDWFDSIVTDKDDKLKHKGLKPGKSNSTLYFKDKFLQNENNTFSAENSNEGILHVLFYLALFISNKTPKLFAIDNIETALNPRLCQALIMELAAISLEKGKQVLITTHNPAILDGLNLLDDNQRLFVVSRNSDGHTKTRRIKFKPDLTDKKFKLSEMWLKGLIGAIPENF